MTRTLAPTVAVYVLVACVGGSSSLTGGLVGNEADAGDACTSLVERARKAKDVVVSAHLACTSDDDCVIGGAGCSSGCGDAINKEGTEAVRSDPEVEASCADVQTHGCTSPPLPCAAMQAGCVSGSCQVVVFGHRDAGADSGLLDCAALSQRAQNALAAVIATHQVCDVDEDCTKIENSTSCFDVCAHAVAKAGLDALDAAKAEQEATTCTTFAAEGCRLERPPCVAPGEPACREGTCTLVR